MTGASGMSTTTRQSMSVRKRSHASFDHTDGSRNTSLRYISQSAASAPSLNS